MDLIISLLFESPTTLFILAVLVCGTLLVMWRRTGSDGRRKAFVITSCVFALFLVLQAVVETNREKIIHLIGDLAVAVERGDLDRIERAIDDEYRLNDVDRARVMPAIRAQLTQYTVERPRVFNFGVNVSGDKATAQFNASCDIRRNDSYFANMPSQWKLQLVRRDGTWKIQSIDALKIAGHDAHGLGALGR